MAVCGYVFIENQLYTKLQVAVYKVILRTNEIKVFAYSNGMASASLGAPIPTAPAQKK